MGDLVIELAQPTEPSSAIASDLDHHQSLYAVTFQVRDLNAARQYLETKAVAFSHEDATTLVTDPDTTHGAVFGFTTWDIPNDARKAY